MQEYRALGEAPLKLTFEEIMFEKTCVMAYFDHLPIQASCWGYKSQQFLDAFARIELPFSA